MKVLVIAPHADDETIGLGGTLAKHAANGDHVTVAVITGHGKDEPHPLWPRDVWDVVRAEARQAMDILGIAELVFDEVPAAQVADQPIYKLNETTRKIVHDVGPEILYVPFPLDLHKDHRELFHSLSVSWRPCSLAGRGIKKVYCYEVQSETHWNIPYVEAGFLPTHFVDISEQLRVKEKALTCYRSQLEPAPSTRSIEAIVSLAQWRGSLVGCAAAEAFVTVRTLG